MQLVFKEPRPPSGVAPKAPGSISSTARVKGRRVRWKSATLFSFLQRAGPRRSTLPRTPAGSRVTPTSTCRAPRRRLSLAAARALLTFLEEVSHHQHPRPGERSRGPLAARSCRERGRRALGALLLPLSVLLGRHDRKLSEKSRPKAGSTCAARGENFRVRGQPLGAQAVMLHVERSPRGRGVSEDPTRCFGEVAWARLRYEPLKSELGFFRLVPKQISVSLK